VFIHVVLHGVFVLVSALLFFVFLFVTGITLFEVETVLNNLPDFMTVANLGIAWVVSLIALFTNFYLFGRNIMR